MNDFVELGKISGRAVAALMASAPLLHTTFTENCAVVFTGEAHPAMNLVIAGVGAETNDLLITSAEFARRRRHPAMALVAPDAASRNSTMAPNWGNTPVGRMPLMVLKDASYSATRVCELVPATNSALLAQAIALRSEGRYAVDSMRKMVNPSLITDPRVDIFVGILRGITVSTVTFTTSGDTAGIWFMATAEPLRRCGIGRSLLSQAIELYRSRGIHRFYLNATSEGESMYKSLGFESIGAWEIWLCAASENQEDLEPDS